MKEKLWMSDLLSRTRVGVIIPCYRVKAHILQVIANVPREVSRIYVVDDCCPDETGKFVSDSTRDPRVQVLAHKENLGVGGAMITGYKRALEEDLSICIKIDGDGQMNPALISKFVRPILAGEADYTKGNRFYRVESIAGMPLPRLFGNAALSFVVKLVVGYWNIMDPNNGYTAVHTSVLRLIPLDKIHRRYFFETDMLFRLGLIKAKVLDIPMDCLYANEQSHLSIMKTIFDFPPKYLSRFWKRIIYTYFLRDFNAGSITLVGGVILTGFGAIFGVYHWWQAYQLNVTTPLGTIMLAALPIIVGIQLLIAFLNYDIFLTPRTSLHTLLDGDE